MTINLKVSMIPQARSLLSTVLPEMIDTDILKPYQDILPKNGLIDVFNAIKYASVALEAMAISKLYSKVCKAFALAAESEAKKQKALVYFDAESRLTNMGQSGGKGGSFTDSAKKAAVDCAEEVLKAKDIRDSWTVLADYFETSTYEFKDRHMFLKLIFEKDLKTGENIEGA